MSDVDEAMECLNNIVSDDPCPMIAASHARNLAAEVERLRAELASLQKLKDATYTDFLLRGEERDEARLSEALRLIEVKDEALKKPCGCKLGLHDSMLLGPEIRCHQVKALAAKMKDGGTK